jgi:hypothetical protein
VPDHLIGADGHDTQMQDIEANLCEAGIVK